VVFATTHWSMVLSAGEADSPEADQALARLCKSYWYPLYAYVRRQGYKPEEAQDLTQEFFARLLAKNYLKSLDRQKGKFRSFLLAAMEHFLAKEWRDARRLKRGGGRPILSLDEQDVEARYLIEPAEEMTAERIFERRWAFTVLEQAIQRLREEFAAAGKGALFESLQGFLSGEKTAYAQLESRLDMSEGAIKVAVHRMRQRYGDLLRQEIANTVSAPEDVDEEVRYLISVISA
jgi:RNA polymerase sigma-70 factor (ECF subfamily)